VAAVLDSLMVWRLRLWGRFTRHVGGLPADPCDFADPYVLRVGSGYFGYATNVGPDNVQVMASPDLHTWRRLGDALPQLPAWSRRGWTWAPAVLSTGGGYVLYYTVREPTSERAAISVAVADRPEGPFVDASSGPLVFQLDRGGSIDPSPFVDDDGTLYLLWKSDDNAFDRPSSLWGQRISPDGMTLVGEPVELLRHDRKWERPLIEGPCLLRVGSWYYLFYSANWWESNRYTVGYAVGRSPLGPFTKVTRRRPWLRSWASAAGPGGQEFFTDADGGLRMSFHAWATAAVGYGRGGARSLYIARVHFSHGVPRIEG
jgi:beta-xylosidase